MHPAARHDNGTTMSASTSVTLVLLAAGVGRRFGGLKQLEPFGPHGETILEYTIHDAIRAGAGRAVLVVRPETEAEFRQTVGRRLERVADVAYVHQSLDEGSRMASGSAQRVKPWGTAHALLCATQAVEGPFVAANADDFYGAGAIANAVAFLKPGSEANAGDHALIGYRLRDTLPGTGRVSRAVCTQDHGQLTDLAEIPQIWRVGDDIIAVDTAGRRRSLSGDEWVSMNLWAFRPGVNTLLRAAFDRFLHEHAASSDAEFQIPVVIRDLVHAGLARVRVIPWTGPWCGVTNRDDLHGVRAHIFDLTVAGAYPSPLAAKPDVATSHDPRQIVRQFDVAGEAASITPLRGGHIHESYVARIEAASGSRRFVLQRINTSVFADVEVLMNNVARVTDHLRRKLQDLNTPDLDRRMLSFVPTQAGLLTHRAPDGSCWRMMRFIERSTAIEFPRSPADAECAGRAFGAFHDLLADLPPPALHETIPHFHDTPRRVSAMEQAIAVDSQNRAHAARAEIEFALSRRSLADDLIEPLRRGELPRRVVHNDAKLSNVLLDTASGEPLCVVDLDTVMPGTVLFDFGDMMRTMLCPAAEDEHDLSKARVDLELFAGLARGYLAATRNLLTPAERGLLVTAGLVITYEQGIRFLTDYLRGDQYYQTTRPGQNLDRCCMQFALLTQLEQHRADLESVVGLHQSK